MSGGFEFKLKGADKLHRKMRAFPGKLQKRGLRSAARKAMNIVRDDARARAKQFDDPSTGEKIWKQIAVSQGGKRSRSQGDVVMRVGVRGGARSSKSKTPPWYWRLLEFGTEKMKAQPFLRPSLENNVSAVTEKLVTELKNEIDRSVGEL